jgi:sugar phosphate isomerase/epimerase
VNGVDRRLKRHAPCAFFPIFAYHVSDWHADTKGILMDRGMMGDGVIDLPGFRRL